MMNILEFVQQMVPSFKRDDLAEKLRMLRIFLEDQTIPAYQGFIETGIKAKSKNLVEFEKEFNKTVHLQVRGQWAEVVLATLQNISSNLSLFETLVDKNYAKDIIASGITFKKAEILRIFAIADFFVTYSRQNLLYLLASEANVEARTLQAGKERPLPELSWLDANKAGYFRSFAVVAMKAADLQRMINDIPEIVITDESVSTTSSTVGSLKLDPLASSMIPITWNPFYYIGVRMANREAARIDRAKNEKRAIEFRLEQLRMQARGENNARLEKTIEFYEQEVNILAAKISKFED
jgi:hypothetical protein